MSTNEGPLITIDMLEDIFSQTLGSIRGSAGIVLWSWTIYSSMSLRVEAQSPLTYLALVWFSCVAITRMVIQLNIRLVSGKKSDWALKTTDDVILVTGGSNGLGLLLTAMFSSDGFTVVNLDLHTPPIDIANTHYFTCNIGDHAQLHETLNSQLPAAGLFPTVLINCAGTVSQSMGSTADLDINTIRNVIDTNVIGTIQTTVEILKINPGLKMVVGISSSTALVAPAYSGVYAASKASVRVFFESLRHELRRKRRTRVLCVTPGQLDTLMFKDVKTPSKFWAPTMRAVDVATSIHDAIINGRQGEISMPTYTRLLPYILYLPQGLLDTLRTYIGVDTAALRSKKRH